MLFSSTTNATEKETTLLRWLEPEKGPWVDRKKRKADRYKKVRERCAA
jgi:hypothetical protein